MKNLRVALSALISLLIVAASPASGLAQTEAPILVLAPELGLPGVVTLQRPAATREIAVPVPNGMQLTQLQAELQVRSEVHQARINISLDGVEVFQATASGGEVVPVDIELETESSEPILRVAAVEITNRSCNAVSIEPVLVTMQNPVFGFTGGQSTADTVGGFFPAHLEHLDIFVPAQRSDAIDQAALQLAAQLTYNYNGQPSFSVREYTGSAPSPSSDGPFDRAVAFAGAAVGKVSIESGPAGSYLNIAGDASVLTDLARTVASPEVALLSGDEIAARPVRRSTVTPDIELRPNWTLEGLGVRSLETEGALSLQLAIPMEQARFGAPISSIRAHLSGFVTGAEDHPVVTVALNGGTLSVLSVDADGRFDTVVVIDRSQMGRENTLTVHSDIDFNCGDSLPWHQLQLSAESRIEVEYGQTLMPGLERFPQAALDGISVDPSVNSQGLEVSINTLAALQQSSPVLLRPTVARAAKIIDSDRAGLIVADTTELSSIAGLIQPDSGRIVAGDIEYSGPSAAVVSMIQASEGPKGQDLLVVHLAEENADLLIGELTGQRWDLEGTAVGFNRDTPIKLTETATNGPSGPNGPLGFVDDQPRPIVQSFGLGLIGAAALFALFMILGNARRRLS